MQKPLQTGYTARTTTNDVIKNIDLTGKTVIITGGSAGLGLEIIMEMNYKLQQII